MRPETLFPTRQVSQEDFSYVCVNQAVTSWLKGCDGSVFVRVVSDLLTSI